MEKQQLFAAFSPVSSTQWKEKIIQDLKGIPYEKLVTHLPEGIDVQPFYQKEHIASLDFLEGIPGQFPFVRGKNTKGNPWKVNQNFPVTHPEKANRQALKAVENGVQSLTFVFEESLQPDKAVLQQLLQNIDSQKLALHFRGVDAATLIPYLSSVFPASQNLKGSVENDPFAGFNRNGDFKTENPFDRMAENVKAAFEWTAVRSVTVDGTLFHNAGGTIVSEIAYTLAMGSFYMQQLTERNLPAGEMAEKILFHFAVGSDYFMEIAKFRAFRYLWAQILKAFGVSEEKAVACIHAESSFRNKTVYDPYVNMLRTTTETMSAILGGADTVTTLPFDATFVEPSVMARRTARNQQHILREESYFDKVADPAAGSYYIETLTANLIDKSWERFLEVEDQGGYRKAFESGWVQNCMEKEAKKKDAEIAGGSVSILGVNRFPNITEHIQDEIDAHIFEPEPVRKSHGIKPLRIYRAAIPFEKLRYATDRFARSHPRPRVWLFTLGDMAIRRARAQFAENFFGCAGYEIIDHSGFVTAAEGIAAAQKESPEIVVLCSDDKTYEAEAQNVFEALKNQSIVVMAGYPKPLTEKLKEAGMKHFIHVKSNLLEELQQFNRLLGIG
jgi:methylmalonyl-CoA mutase